MEMFRDLRRKYERRRQRHRDVVHLNGLSDHLLRDIGLARSQIEAAVYARRDVV